MDNQHSKMSIDLIIDKTIFASVMDNGFWDRWIAHGIDEEYIKENKSKMITLKGWTETLASKAVEYTNQAKDLIEAEDFLQAEHNYRKAGIYYNLIQWVFPEPSGKRTEWYKQCLEQYDLADKVSDDKITRHNLTVDGKTFYGRIRVPQEEVAGVVILFMPIDSTKEEFYLYEQDFVKNQFVVVSFDGPGQGEGLFIHGHKAEINLWEKFSKSLVEYIFDEFPNLPINLFGTSSGGAWAIEASKNSQVSKTVVVSPPPKFISNIRLPDYFKERMNNMLVYPEKGTLPLYENVESVGGILVAHGAKDVLVNEEELIELFNRFAPEKRFITYENEGHCCNYKLGEIRQRASQWFKGGDINEI